VSTKLYPDNHLTEKRANHEELELKKRNGVIELRIEGNNVFDRRISYFMSNIDYRLEHKQTRSIQHYLQKEVLD
jgi:hypothetical protein